MPFRSSSFLPVSFLAILSFVSVVEAECYVAAYGLVGKQDGWIACPGTASTSGGIETCCMPGSECGEDSLCHEPASDDPRDEVWYQAGCTDPNYENAVCRKNCVDYTQSYVQYDSTTQLWMCCGNGGCNGTVTDDTFTAVAPSEWRAITKGSLSSTSSPAATSPASSATDGPNRSSSVGFKPTPTGSHSETIPPGSKDERVGLSTGAKAGIGVGISVVILALVAALLSIFISGRKRKQEQQDTIYEKSIPTEWYAPPAEVGSENSISELPNNRNVHELAGK